MDTLDDYLTGPYVADIRDISSVENIIQDVCKTLAATFNGSKGWPYAVDRKKKIELDDLSQSTTCMVSLSLWKLLHKWKRPNKFGNSPTFPKVEINDSDSILDIAERSASILFGDVSKDGVVSTKSRSYGKDDPLTLSFLANICEVDFVKRIPQYGIVREYIEDKIQKFLNKNSDIVLPSGEIFSELDKDIGNYAVDNAIIYLRIIQSNTIFQESSSDNLHGFRVYFEKNLHEQLSFSSIPDSRFDPAELAFCLEGLLLVQKDAVDRTLFKRVLEVLAKAQEQSAFWRPVKPFMANSKGFSLFPVSVEVANSLLRSCELYDGANLHETFGSMSIHLLRRYWQWLRARIVRFHKDGKEYIGWHSEHINETDSIHIWETSQVLEFLLNYRRALQAHIARTTLVLSRFLLREPKKKEWSELENKYQPVTVLGQKYAVYSEIGADFVVGWKNLQPALFSMLLYGPPGTGKTTVAKSIADALNVRMVTITVSDFLAGGGAQLEARAKAIFDVLQSQSGIVVLFDEIDNFLLDRDSKRYSKQDSVFQFMTPGMLTKLNDLRQSERILFVIATNYENRIDSAIKRTGRVDKRYLVLPPDASARRQILTYLVREKSPLGTMNGWGESDWEKLKKSSLFLGYTDMEAAVIEYAKRGAGAVDELVRNLTERARTIDPASYRLKFDNGDEAMDNSYPLEEFFALLALAAEVGDDLTSIATQRSILAAKQAMDDAEGFEKSFPTLASTALGGKIKGVLDRADSERSAE
ncbi:AAA family ATPase [Mesorhizobium sp. B2-1-3A]|uniref:AAA family ATPase n=1 Tax=Mesorhizobium sp. B2-1-3A TaxID=2589971 RepID=UPI00112DC83E|nr:AAA family ATPase [Mesorhizobium sp. B2-1-3A]TPM94438.1 AAA family ATPase [Mesorhizobium sp. B2-1-3A]